jgi:hypothetical protein
MSGVLSETLVEAIARPRQIARFQLRDVEKTTP